MELIRSWLKHDAAWHAHRGKLSSPINDLTRKRINV